ncbi:hypothetical protein J2T12_005355 [Paenibacillus anaericanus]|uniref:DUF370 domain-containing protein n=1 Tax=Paenibacillus anaericanus TaxID=170367 RepID=A0A433YB21_9BACL|nr:extracellular matrix/biofilm biosynthesis regulator RemA family protein [Paenibacillus anaericanus]MDQ0091912.1 hypothetical protein [Paenibacillus anaericanus]RUT47071.1 DUF370 domain-containing protein [Paenibacillus anaericanus]
MYIHLGGEKVIFSSELVAIFDISVEKSSKVSKQFVSNALEGKNLMRIGEEVAKSIVVTKNMVYYSPISSATLKKKANIIFTV